MMKSYVYSNFSVPNTNEGVNNEVGWKFSPKGKFDQTST